MRMDRGTFDVICAGEALWHLASADDLRATGGPAVRFRPAGGAVVVVAMALAKRGLRVGLATSLADDAFGRSLYARVESAGVDVGGVVLRAPRTGIVLLDGKGLDRQVVSYRDEEQPILLPRGWSSRVLLLAGLSPVVANAASLCKAARAARRVHTRVVVDVNARWHLWAGRDSRATHMVLYEADVVHCRTEDLAALGLDEARVRAVLRPSAVLVVTNIAGEAWATGPFGEVGEVPRGGHLGGDRTVVRSGAGDAFVASICAEVVRASEPVEGRIDVWHRALARGRDAVARA
jgi:sugar/nucleoside kinase (ribokinase family)